MGNFYRKIRLRSGIPGNGEFLGRVSLDGEKTSTQVRKKLLPAH
jgi:hypothetical protein